ncbi:unnamed protein product, partial [Rotaria sp. Silwood2]
QEKIFSNTLNFVSTDNVFSIDQHKLDRFCKDILPKIHQNVECFILEALSMERILLAADYPNLTELKLFNFTQEDDLPNLKCFSLKCYRLIDKYDEKILPLHRMIYHRDTFIDSFHLQNEILLYIPRLHSFTLYISTY